MKVKRELPLSQESLIYMQILASRVGIELNVYKEDAIYYRLVRRLRALQLSDFDAYCQRLRIDIEEEIKFINLITNITTFFFRENHHFEALGKRLLPELLVKKNKIRIWSAACATGEEPYSIAIVVHENISNITEYDIKILATDVNADALLIARRGVYSFSDLKKMNLERRYLWFHKIKDKDSSLFRVNSPLRQMITFRELNLIHIWPFHNKFDVIFCRNVLFYFKKEIISDLLHHLDMFLAIGGFLIVGFSENIDSIKENYTSLGKTIYQKVR